ncbi:MAG: NnrU family protein [Mesorhizobium sp.]
MFVLVLGLILFLGIHSVRIVAPGWRDAKLAAMGNGWRGLYSLVSAVGLVLIVWGYSLAWPAGPVLYDPPLWTKHVAALLMLFALIALAVSQLPGGKLKKMLKHPMLLSVKIWAFAHLLANGELASLLLFGSFLAWAVADRISLKRRGDTGPKVAGPIVWDAVAVAVGIVLYLLFVFGLHLWLFGADPLARG